VISRNGGILPSPAATTSMAPSSSVPLATLLVLPDLKPLAQRLLAVLRHLSPELADGFHLEAERLGRAVVFSGDPLEAEAMRRDLQAAGLTTSINLRYVPLALAAAD
jgi:hypothetical protein